MKKHIISLIISLIALTNLNAGTIKGHIINSKGGVGVSYASVAIIKAGEADAFAGSISDEEGNFIVKNIPNGEYKAVVSFIGFETKEVDNIVISSKESRIELGNIVLTESTVGLAEVNVSVAQSTSENKIDRKTYRATDFETTKGGTAIDVLSKLPSVSVDSDGQVSMRGTSSFMVYINGKPSANNSNDILSQIPSDNIADIDIITVPTSKYDAQGKGGIINITTKRSTVEGLSLIATGMIGGTPWTNADDDYNDQKLDNNRYNGGLNLMYNKDKLSLTGAFNMQSRHNKGVGIIDPYIYQQPGEVNNGLDGKYYVLDGQGSRPKWYSNMLISGGASYKLTENSELSANYQYSQRKSGRTANYKYDAYFANSPTGAPIDITGDAMPDIDEIYNPNDIHRDGWFSNMSLDYNVKIDDDSKLSASITYEASNLEQTIENHEFDYIGESQYYDYNNYKKDGYTYPIEPRFHSFQSDETPLDAFRLALDYETKLANGDKLESGIQAQLVNLDGIFNYDTIIGNDYWGDPSISSYDNEIDLSRHVYAAYADYSGERGKLSYILGLRMEYLDQEMNVASTEYFRYVYGYFEDINDRDFDQKDFKQNKFDIFPTIHLGYQMNETNNLSLAASRRINRPPAKDMAPFLYRRHQEIYEMGDPLLEPEYIFNAEMTYTRDFGENNNVSLTGFYRDVNNAIYRVNRVAYDMGNPGGVLLRSYTNAGDQVALGAELGLNLDLIDKVKVYLGGSLYDFRIIADDELLGESRDSRSINWSLKSNIAWQIISPLKLTLDYSIKSGSVTPQGESLEFQALNAALNYSPKKWENWTFSAKMLDILGTNQAGGYTAAYDGGQILLRRDYVYDYEGQIVEVGATYTFNNRKHKANKKLIGDEYF